MKAHIREEKKTTPLKLGNGTLFQNKDGKIYKVCDTTEYDETHTGLYSHLYTRTSMPLY